VPNDTDPRNQLNDEFGYAVYAIWVYASEHQIDQIARLRRTMLANRQVLPAYVAAGAHVTLKSLFRDITDLARLKVITQEIANTNRPFFLHLDQTAIEWGDGDHTSAIPVVPDKSLISLNGRLESAIGPLSGQRFGGSEYTPHMTVYQDATESEVIRGRELVRKLNLRDGFEVISLELVGRVGPFATGHWESLGKYPLIGDSD
jgi:2'-5' RNA ligase